MSYVVGFALVTGVALTAGWAGVLAWGAFAAVAWVFE
jgi:hypothetical protein